MSGPNLRERRRLVTEREIARAALDLVLERGLADVTVEDIAAAAGISVRTFFNYFPSRKSAVIHGPEPLAAAAVERFVVDRETPLLDGLRALLTEHVATWSDPRHEVRRVQRVLSAHPELMAVLHERVVEFESVLVDAIARRLDVPPDDHRPLVAAAVSGALLRVAVTRRVGDGEEPLEVDLTRAFDTLRRLLAI